VSVLDRCQYRCAYCRPGAVSPFVGREEWLSVDDYARLAAAFGEIGVNKVRFTGGEPLLRPDLSGIVRAFRDHIPGCHLALTTNGQLLDRKLDALIEAGLNGATVHIDSLRPERYRELMGDGDVRLVVDALLRAQARLPEVKLNTVIQRGKNVDEIGDFITFSRSTGIEVRFIELMTTGSAVEYTRETFFTGRAIVDAVRTLAGATPIERRCASDPAALWKTDDGVVFGIIASDTESFCAQCNRLRLTANGNLRGCLYQGSGIDLTGPLRAAGDQEIRAGIRRAITEKRSYHPDAMPKKRLRFSMAQTGG
jgi:cyclic pyranopterin phosphate synthase